MCLEAAYRRDQLQPRAHGLLCIVLLSLGEAEINQDAIARVRCYEAAEALHSLCDALVVGRDDFAEVLRIHLRW